MDGEGNDTEAEDGIDPKIHAEAFSEPLYKPKISTIFSGKDLGGSIPETSLIQEFLVLKQSFIATIALAVMTYCRDRRQEE